MTWVFHSPLPPPVWSRRISRGVLVFSFSPEKVHVASFFFVSSLIPYLGCLGYIRYERNREKDESLKFMSDQNRKKTWTIPPQKNEKRKKRLAFNGEWAAQWKILCSENDLSSEMRPGGYGHPSPLAQILASRPKSHSRGPIPVSRPKSYPRIGFGP